MIIKEQSFSKPTIKIVLLEPKLLFIFFLLKRENKGVSAAIPT